MPTATWNRPRARVPATGHSRLRLTRAGLHTRSTERIRDLIVQGHLRPGDAIPETELCAALGVSRTPLREALKLLAAEGLVELRPNRSPRIIPMRPDENQELFEAVSGIERVAAELAAQRATPAELRRLRALQERMEKDYQSRRLESYFVLNQKIHSMIVSLAKNMVLKATHNWLLGRVERARYFALSREDRWDESVTEHREILAALEARDADRAGHLLARHVKRTGEVVNALLREQGSEEEVSR